MTAIVTAAPLLFVRYAPFTDLPEHVAAMATIAERAPGFDVAFGSSQYLLYHLVGALLTRVLGGDALLANRILLAGVAVAWPLSLRALLRAFGRDERLAILGCMVFWNRALCIGFLPFVASVPLALFAVARARTHLEAPTARRGVVLALLGLALFYTHVSSFLVFVATTGALALVLAAQTRRVTGALPALLPLAPSVVALLLWRRAGSLEEGASRLPLEATVAAVPIWTFEIWTSHVDELCAVAWWGAFIAIAGFGLRLEPRRGAWIAVVPFVVAAATLLVTPFRVGAAGYLNVRLAPLLTLLALLTLRPCEGRRGDVPLAIAALASIAMAGDALFEMRRLEREVLGDLDGLLAKARPGSRLAMLNFEVASPRSVFWPYPFAGSYHRARGGAIASYSFAELSHWPVHYAPGAAPPRHVPFWVYNPCVYRYRLDGAYYDYVLVQGERDPFADEALPGPRFERVGHSGRFALYAKSSVRAVNAGSRPGRSRWCTRCRTKWREPDARVANPSPASSPSREPRRIAPTRIKNS